jgi:predicted TIM-barrel fold metal-dependent hydrolase
MATIDDYRAVMDAYGIERAVLVQPSAYGFDNSALFDALEAMPDGLRGVAVLAPDAPDETFERAHRLGVRGVRINPRNPAGLTMKDVAGVAERIAPWGWHIQFQISVEDVEDIGAIVANVANVGVPVVVDHFGFPDLAAGPDARPFRSLVKAAAAGACRVKLSAPYRVAGAVDRSGELGPFVERLVAEAPDALLWALDWPHTECFASVPDDGDLVDLVQRWLPTTELRQTVLCDNPARLYWVEGTVPGTKPGPR